MLFKNIALLDENMEVRQNMYVGILADKIQYISNQAPEPKQDFGEIYDGANKLLIPGLYNAHAHTPMTLLRGYGENMTLQDWLEKRIFPFEAKMTGEDVYYGYLLGVAEMLRFGVVSTTDMYYFGASMARAVIDSGFKSNIGLSVVCFTDQSYEELPIYQEIVDVYKTYHMAGQGRLRTDLSVHAEYTSTPKVVSAIARHCLDLGLRMHIHLSETKQEHEACKARHQGQTPAQYFQAMGLFKNPTTAAHCVWLEPEDFRILAENGVTIAANPISNLKLASGICNVPYAMEQGINVALGTDSVASNNNLNMFEEIKLHALLHKYHSGNPTLITPAQAIMAATRNGALSQGRTDCGLIKEGYQADLAVLNIDQPYMKPVHNLLNNLVYSACGTDVCLTMVDGKVLYRDGEYPSLDLEKITYEVERARQRILSQL
jgi:5-methylthioadenosine/S-adenosylhomocysteine deaminase